jgi:prevent-host-death family protein
MKQLNLAKAKAKLSHLVDQAAKGKGVIIAKSGIPMAKLVPLDDDKPKEFKFGTLNGVADQRWPVGAWAEVRGYAASRFSGSIRARSFAMARSAIRMS